MTKSKVDELLEPLAISKEPPDDIFETLEIIGKGTYGVVLKAKHRESGDIVAIKQTLVAETVDIEATVREIRVLESCNHRNVVQYYGTYRTPTAVWVAIEYCDGGSIDLVRKILKKNLPEPLIAYVLHETLLGLQYMHEHHLIHRDVKAGNILFTSKGEIKLADFGITAELSHTFSRRNSYWGTVLYMAPEVLKESDYDEKADIWSLGITTLEMAEGALPFSRLQEYPLLEFLTRQAPPSLQHKDRFSPQMNVFIRRMLTQDKYARPSAAIMLEDSFLHRDYAALQEEMAVLVAQLQERRAEIGADPAEDWNWSSSAEDATFVAREDSEHGPVTRGGEPQPGAGAAPPAAEGWSKAEANVAQEASLQQQLPPLPLFSAADFSFDALQYACEDPKPLKPTEICSLLTFRPLVAPERLASSPSSPSIPGFEDSPPRVMLHSTKMLQYLYLYYSQLSSMRCLTKQEASDMVKTKSKMEDTLAVLYRLRRKRR